MTTTPNMNLVLPVEGGSSNVWDVVLDTLFNRIDGHTHLTGSGVPIVSAALNINADVPLGANAFTGAKAFSFTQQATSAVTSYVNGLFVNSADANLYFRNASGTNVQVTSGSTLNISIVGGIGGDYASVSALFSYDDATKRYLAQQEVTTLVRPWAGFATADIDLYQKALVTGSPASNKVTFKSHPSLTISYPIVFPDNDGSGGPGVGAWLIDNSGNLLFTNTWPANASLTLSGSGTYKHGTKFINKSVGTANSTCSAGSVSNTGGTTGIQLANDTIVYLPCPEIPQHARLVSVAVYFNSATDRGHCTSVLYVSSAADPATSTLTTTGIALGNSGTAISSNTAALQLTGSQTFWVQISNGANTPSVQAIVVGYDVP
jgi:hypothetical protein